MVRIHKPLKAALDHLGAAYTVKTIDGELCAYRDLGNGYDFEISCSKRGYTAWVWQLRPGLKTVEWTGGCFKTLAQLESWLNQMANKYGALE